MLNIELAVKCERETSPFFKTDTGVPQGDGYSANEFTYYLANSQYQQQHIDHDYAAVLRVIDHDYAKLESAVEVDIDMEYADDITYLTTCKKLRILKKRELPAVLAKRGLDVNDTKTEEYSISRGGDENWKCCKLLGSLLGTEEDIARRKALAVAAIRSKSDIFYSNLDIPMKMRAFNCYVGSIFLYNCELWGLTRSQKDAIDAFHRRLLRTAVLNVRWPRKVSNEDLYGITGATPWSETIQTRSLSWFGHLIRLDEQVPAKIALRNALIAADRPRGRPLTTWLSAMKDLFKSMGLTWERAEEMARDRKLWNSIIT